MRTLKEHGVRIPEDIAVVGFNNDDFTAREALQPFYSKDRNWLEENLVREDQSIVKWREVCHRHARGIQLPKHVDP